MPSKSKAQQRFFGMVRACQKGELKNPSKAVKDAAEDMSVKDVKKFAKTKQEGLPEHVKKKKTVKVTESQLHNIIAESVKRVLSEVSDAELQDVYGTEYDEWNKNREEAKALFLKVYPDYSGQIDEYLESGEDTPQASIGSRISAFEKFMEDNGYFPL